MFESDADRLALIRALGGVSIQGPRGEFTGIIEQPFYESGDLAVASSAPKLTARTVDLERCGVVVGSTVRSTEVFLIRALKPDGLGMTEADLELP